MKALEESLSTPRGKSIVWFLDGKHAIAALLPWETPVPPRLWNRNHGLGRF
jgi:hypothetical protein